MPELSDQENFILPTKKPWYKTGRGVGLFFFLSILIVTIFIFIGFFGYYAWQIKYGDIRQIEQAFEDSKFSVASNLANNINSTKIIIEDWPRYIHAFNPTSGELGAPVTIIVFIDFQCPYSQEAYPVFKIVSEKYADIVKVVFKHLSVNDIHPEAMQAADAATCAQAQGRFWDYYDKLFMAPSLDTDTLVLEANDLGLHMEDFVACLDGEAYREQINTDSLDAVSMGVRGTPTYFVNGLKVEGAITADEWDRIILEFLKS